MWEGKKDTFSGNPAGIINRARKNATADRGITSICVFVSKKRHLHSTV